MKLRTYPRVDLSKVNSWITALTFYSLPLTEMSSKKLAERERNGTLPKDLKERLKLWKRSMLIEDADDLEYKYFLEGIEAIHDRNLTAEDLVISLSENLTIGDILPSRSSSVKLYYLSRFGSILSEYLSLKQHNLYEAALFWMLIRSSRFNPLVQAVLSDKRLYQTGFRDDLIPSHDGISRNLVKKWLRYFDLLREDRLSAPRLIVMLSYSLVMEINEQLTQKARIREYVEELCRYMSKRFSIAATIDFSVLLDLVYLHVDRKVIAGFPSGRGHEGLPSRPNIQILEINECIPLSIIEKLQPFDATKAIKFGGIYD